jgi:hypothetical protein
MPCAACRKHREAIKAAAVRFDAKGIVKELSAAAVTARENAGRRLVQMTTDWPNGEVALGSPENSLRVRPGQYARIFAQGFGDVPRP